MFSNFLTRFIEAGHQDLDWVVGPITKHVKLLREGWPTARSRERALQAGWDGTDVLPDRPWT